MFEKSGRNRHGQRLTKPVMYEPTDSEWGLLSPRPLTRWTKRRPTKRVAILLVFLFVASVYGVRLWREHHPPRDPTRLDAERYYELKQQEMAKQRVQGAQGRNKGKGREDKPPLFERYHDAELALPQHHVDDPFANGKKYLWVENHVHGELSSLRC